MSSGLTPVVEGGGEERHHSSGEQRPRPRESWRVSSLFTNVPNGEGPQSIHPMSVSENTQSPLAKRAWWGAYGHSGFSWNGPPPFFPLGSLPASQEGVEGYQCSILTAGVCACLEAHSAWRCTKTPPLLLISGVTC